MKIEKLNNGFYQMDCNNDKRILNRQQLFDLYCAIEDILEEERLNLIIEK